MHDDEPPGDPSALHTRRERTALVLSGGGVRGAYEVGVVQGIIEALGLTAADPSPFAVFAGTSVGAINATYLAACAERGDLGIASLAALWTQLRLDVHLRLKLREVVSIGRWLGRARPRDAGWSLLDVDPLERLVRDGIPWTRLRANIGAGRVHALIVAALEVATGRTTMFAELAPGVVFEPSRDPARAARRGPIGRAHVLASAALPLLFPAREIDGGYYCDGGLRFNTPLAPAIRAGATRLVVVSLLPAARGAVHHGRSFHPGVGFLVGKLLNAVLADPIAYDLQVVDRFNRLLEVLHDTMAPAALERVQSVLVDTRGARYERLETLVFRPSRDLGVMAGAHLLRPRAPGAAHHGGAAGWLMTQAMLRSPVPEADWASYVLFDGAFARELIDLGRADAVRRADEIRRFFALPVAVVGDDPRRPGDVT